MGKYHVLPSAGSASRIGGLPKYLLPVGKSAKPLIYYHIKMAANNGISVIVVVHPSMFNFVTELCSTWPFPDVLVKEKITISMTESCIDAVDGLSNEDSISISMPDTFFSEMLECDDFNPLDELHDLAPALALWRIQNFQIGNLGQVLIDSKSDQVSEIIDKDKNCPYIFSWGMLALKVSLLRSFPLSDAHPGISFARLVTSGTVINSTKVHGRYFDCGTISEFRDVLNLSLS